MAIFSKNVFIKTAEEPRHFYFNARMRKRGGGVFRGRGVNRKNTVSPKQLGLTYTKMK